MRVDDTLRYDAVVAGGSLGGLVSAAILAHRGYRVAVVETLPRPGGRVGAVEHDGYWIGWGHRDGHGIGDLAFIPRHLHTAAAEAGVELRLRPFVGRSVRVHWLPDGVATELPADTLVPDERDPMATYREMVRFFGGVTEDVDGVARRMLDVMTRLAAMDDEQAWQLVPVRMGDWLARNVGDSAVRRTLLQQFECIPFTPAEETSVGRFVLHLKSVQGMAVIPDDPEVGAMQGVVAPWVRALRERGADLWFGWKPIEIVVEDGEAAGVVAVDEASLVRVFRAPIVITDHFGWDLPRLVDERLLPPGFLEAARRTERYGSDAVSWWAGLDRLPTRRSDGQVEDLSSPWQRILYGGGAVKACHGGFYFPSGFSTAAAPEGKHLLGVEMVAPGEDDGPRWRTWADARETIDRCVDYLHRYYGDLDERVEWSSYQYCTPPQYLSWYAKPAYRHPVKVSTIAGLYVASSSAEGHGAWVDSECASALTAVDLADEERGHLRGAAPTSAGDGRATALP